MIATVIAIHNRPEYVQRCFASLRKLKRQPDLYILVDDASTDPFIDDILTEFAHPYGACIITNGMNMGVRGSLQRGIASAIQQQADNILVLDSDVILRPDALDVIVQLWNEHPDKMVSGINCTMLNERGAVRNPIVSEHDGYAIKSAVAGQCLYFDVEQYRKWIAPALNIMGNWDHNASINACKDVDGIVVAVPSVAQHIGMRSSMGHHFAHPDRANDFKLLSLPDVTLFGIDSHDIAGIERAARISTEMIDFAQVNIITADLFTKGGSNEQRRKDYSTFMIKELAKHFTTSHVLTIHADGYVVNPEAWRPEWLEYDYIGATWWYKDGHNVGNGGFSLRSKKLCDILAENEIDEKLMHPEDDCICRKYRHALETVYGIKFAPEEVANRFAIEAYSTPKPYNMHTGQFGFHSRHVGFEYSDVPPEWWLTPPSRTALRRV